jgi:PTH1 family peptidyl-tRNA hydrolase
MAVDRLAKDLGTTFSRVEADSLIAKTSYEGKRIILIKPQTYMNNSGRAVKQLVKYYKIPLENSIILFDDVDLPLGTIRIRTEGGSGGQKGMASIIQHLGTQSFPRLRIGIGRPPGKMDAAAYVLQNFSKSEKEILEITIDKAVKAVQTFISYDIETAMNKFNGDVT